MIEIRRSGRTTIILLKAITALLEGNDVVVVGYNYKMAYHLASIAVDILGPLVPIKFSTKSLGTKSLGIKFRPACLVGYTSNVENFIEVRDREYEMLFVCKSMYRKTSTLNYKVFEDHYKCQH